MMNASKEVRKMKETRHQKSDLDDMIFEQETATASEK